MGNKLPNSQYPENCSQIILVKGLSASSHEATMQFFEKKGREWQAGNYEFEAVIGKKGLAWGGSEADKPEGMNLKVEGDLRAPVGLFKIVYAFGYAPKLDLNPSLPYLQVSEGFVGIDDPASKYYNCIVNSKIFPDKDWSSAEQMYRTDGLYKWGFVIDYNFENAIPGRGSCIFIHLWRGAGQGTEGCIAISEENMLELIKFLDLNLNPVIMVN
jgi:L,D-peptidoglycan transpeptidase YkuD (ErfK/YbiS/YcfS/YnhG family)